MRINYVNTLKPNHWHRRERNRQYLFDYLSKSKCMDCGETDIATLQLDHQHGKLYDMSKAVKNRIGLAKLQAEIDKCHVVCANCHMRRTAKQQDWYRRLNVS